DQADADSVRHGVHLLLETYQKLSTRGLEPETLMACMRGNTSANGLGDLRPADAARFSFVHSLAAETQGLSCHGVELPASLIDVTPDRAAALLVEELLHCPPSQRTLVAYRNSGRYVRKYMPIALEWDQEAISTQVRNLVITGGFGGIGLAVAQYYAT